MAVGESTASFLDGSGVRRLRPSGEEIVGDQLWCVLDCAHPVSHAPTRFSLADVREVVLGRGDLRRSERSDRVLRLAVPDAWMSSRHALLRRGEAGWSLEDLGSKNGTLVNGQAVHTTVLGDGEVISLGNTLWLFRSQVRELAGSPIDVDSTMCAGSSQLFGTLVPELERSFRRLERVARTALPILLTGETGTGKEVVARSVHKLSGRRGRFVAVNCGALPAPLIEAELFGAARGAFSGATQDRVGLLRVADGGTLFLDELAELPVSSQVALLRVLQEREVRPVGSTHAIPVDLRVIAATHQDLPQRVADGRLRQDLYARLDGFRMTLPPLRERREDLGLLVASLLERLCGDRARAICFHRAAGAALLAHAWPRNIRELELALGAAVALADGATIGLEHLPSGLGASTGRSRGGAAPGPLQAGKVHLEQFVGLLREHRGNVSAVARALSTSRSHVRRLVERFQLDLGEFR